MSVTLVLTLLAATLPLAAVGWAAALLAERLKVDAATRGGLWLAALVAPLALAPALPLGWLAHTLTPAPTHAVPVAPAPALAAPVAQHAAPAATTAAPSETHLPYAAILLALVAGGVTVRLGLLTLRLARASRLRARTLRAEPPVLQAALQVQAARLGVRPPALRLWDGSQPVLVGLRRPAILVPRRLAAELDETRLGLILAHELGHLRAGDPWRMVLAELAGALMWFNPFSRFSLIALAQVREEICDAVVLKGVDRPTRQAYAETLMAALREQAGITLALAFTGARRRTAQRMAAILRPGPVSARRAALCAGGASIALIGSLGSLAYAAAGALPVPALPRIVKAAAPAGTRAPARLIPVLAQDAATRSNPAAPARPTAAQTAIDQAEARMDRIQSLYQQGVAPRSELDAAAAGLARARRDGATDVAGRAAASEALINQAKSQLIRQQALYDQGVAPLYKVQEAAAELASVQQDFGADPTERAATNQRLLDQAQARLARTESLYQQGVASSSALADAQRSLNTLQLAQAQPAPTTLTMSPPRPPAVYIAADLLSKPTAAQILEAYPSRAKDAGIGGSATLSCQVDVHGGVSSCTVVSESPRGEQFSAAALRLQQFFRMRPKIQDGAPVAGTATIPVVFTPPTLAPSARLLNREDMLRTGAIDVAGVLATQIY